MTESTQPPAKNALVHLPVRWWIGSRAMTRQRASGTWGLAVIPLPQAIKVMLR